MRRQPSRMMMEALLLLAIAVRVIHAKEECPPNCLVCMSGRCRICSPGYIGGSCSIHCTNCKNTRCAQHQGCVDGCKPGWHGYMCDEVCTCPQGTCDQFTGACPDQCKPGHCALSCGGACRPEKHGNYGVSVHLSWDKILVVTFVLAFMVISSVYTYIKFRNRTRATLADESGTVRDLYSGTRSVSGADSPFYDSSAFTSLLAPDTERHDSHCASQSLDDTYSARSSVSTNVAGSSVNEMAPPSYEQCMAPPPAYDVLFRKAPQESEV